MSLSRYLYTNGRDVFVGTAKSTSGIGSKLSINIYNCEVNASTGGTAGISTFIKQFNYRKQRTINVAVLTLRYQVG